jgi:hypothetical protein
MGMGMGMAVVVYGSKKDGRNDEPIEHPSVM